MTIILKRTFAAAATLLATTGAALAHSGHGMEGTHWHASDVWGFGVVAVLATLALWFSRGDH